MTSCPSAETQYLSVVPGHIPTELKALPQWVVWKMAPDPQGRPTKTPFQVRGAKARTNDPATWTTFAEAHACYRSGGWDGIGPVFHAADPYCGVDLDGCRNPETGEISPWAKYWIDLFGSYVEISPSGTGVKIWIRAKWPDDAGHKKKLPDVPAINGKTPAVEVYDSVRFFAMTGRVLGDMTEIRDCQSILDQFRATYWPPRPPRAASTRPCSQSESQVIDRAKKYIATIPPAVSGQGGHDVTFHVACVLVLEFGLSVDDALDAIQDWNAACDPPWTEKELLHKLEDADKQSGERGRLRNSELGNPNQGSPVGVGLDGDYHGGNSPELSAREPGDESEADTEPPPKRLKITWAGELIKLYPTMRRCIVDGLLRAGETMNVISAPKVGKSWLVLGLALSVATGRSWLDRFPTSGGKVLLIDNELHGETLAERLPRVAMAMGIDPTEYAGRLAIVSLRGELVDLNSLIVQMGDIAPGDFDLIILDAWYRFQPPGTDENSNADTIALYNLVDYAAARLGSAFVCVHHSTKSNQSGKAITDVGAGAGAQARAADTHLILRQHEVENAFVADAAVRSWKPHKPFVMRLEFPAWQIDDYLDPADIRKDKPKRSTVSAGAAQERDGPRNEKEESDRAELLARCQQHPEGETQTVLRGTHINSLNFKKLINELIELGLVETFKGKKARMSVDMYRPTEAGQVGQAGQNQQSSGLSDPDKNRSDKPLCNSGCPSDLSVRADKRNGKEKLSDLTDRSLLDGIPDMDLD